jgi:dTDP-glucose 4,6-dehydratase
MNKKILIIGSNSFAGSSFVNFCLNSKIKIIGVSRSKEKPIFCPYKENKFRKNFIFFKINLNIDSDQKKLIKIIKKNKINIIVNFAAQGMVAESWKTPEDWYNTNIVSSVAFINKLKVFKNSIKFINFSTPEVYGNTKKIIKENNNFKSTTPYALSRATFDNHLFLLNKYQKFPVIITRASNIFGPYQQLYRIIPKTIISFLKRKKIILDGNGSSVRSFIYIDDVSNALLRICYNGKIGSTYHISTNNFISIEELVKLISLKMSAKKLISLKKEDRLGKDFAYKLNSSFLRKSLKWKPLIELQQGLDKTINWISNDFAKLKKISTNYNHKK